MLRGLGKGRRVAPKFCQAVVLFLGRGINGERCSRKAGCAVLVAGPLAQTRFLIQIMPSAAVCWLFW